MAERRFEGKVVWITGGGSGIGRALALAFADEGARVAVSGRRRHRLDEVVAEVAERGQVGLAIPCDVSEEAEIVAAVDAVISEWGRLDVAVANAGFAVAGPVSSLNQSDWRRQFDVNVIGAALTVRHAMDHLRKVNGRAVFMGSVASQLPLPGNSAYHASKHALRAISESLSLELVGTGVSCTHIQPGFVASEINQVDNKGNFREEWSDRAGPVIKWLRWSAEDAARVCVSAIHDRRRAFTFTGHGKVAAALGRYTPGVVHTLMAGSQLLQKRGKE